MIGQIAQVFAMPKTCLSPNCSNPVFSHNYCRYHQNLRTDSKKPKGLSKISPQRKVRMEGRTEIDVFKEIWADREHISELSGLPLPYGTETPQMWVKQFLHVINKGRSPELRLDKDNIMLGTPFEHENQDQYEKFRLRKVEMLNRLYVVK